ncbi:MAG: UDP-N-acetylmuramoyl-L-alanine--D-glutamate ligase, partial [Patescibacteria group bacterium]
MRLADLSNKLVIILGFGREGKAAYDVLKSRVPTARIIVTDEQKMNVAEFRDLVDAITATTAETIVIKSPGIPWHRAYVEEMQNAGAHFTSTTNVFFAERKRMRTLPLTKGESEGVLIGVTGTKGKSTTSSLLAHVLHEAGKRVVLAGNIGEPAIAHLDEPDDTIFVLEMSSYQLLDLTIAPDIAVILNLYEEHMDYHGDVASYHAAKMRIADLQTANDLFVYNEKFPQLVDLAKRVKSKTLPFALRDDKSLDAITLLGDHNRENAAGVLAVTDELDIDRAIVERAFASFKSLPHRLQEVGVINDIRFINDSFCTTPHAALAAIDVFERDLGAIILGGHDRGYDFSELAQRVSDL